MQKEMEIRKSFRGILNEYLSDNIQPEYRTRDYFEKLAEVIENIILSLPEDYPIKQSQLIEITISALVNILKKNEIEYMINQHQLDVVKSITKKMNDDQLIFTEINSLLNKQLEFEYENNFSVKS